MIYKYQQGGQAQQDPIEAIKQVGMAAAQGDQQAAQQLMQFLQQAGEQAQQVVQVLSQQAQQGDQAAQATIQVIQALTQQVQSARNGAKLYLKTLRGECPDGYQPVRFKLGGKTCTKCMAKKAEQGVKAKKDAVSEFKCGRKVKKAQNSTKLNMPNKQFYKVLTPEDLSELLRSELNKGTVPVTKPILRKGEGYYQNMPNRIDPNVNPQEFEQKLPYKRPTRPSNINPLVNL